MREIRPKDIVLHELSGLYFICLDNKQARWMSMNPYYKLKEGIKLPDNYFAKN